MMNVFETEHTPMNGTQAESNIDNTEEETEMTNYEVSKTTDKNDRLYFEDLKTAEDVKAYNAQKELREIKYDGEGEYIVNIVCLVDEKVNIQKGKMKFNNPLAIPKYIAWFYGGSKAEEVKVKHMLMLYQKIDDGINLDEPLSEKDPKVHTYIVDKKTVSNYIRAKASKEKKEANKVGRKKKEEYVFVPDEDQMNLLMACGITKFIPAPTRKRRKKAEQAAEPAEVKVVDQTEELIEQAEDMRI